MIKVSFGGGGCGISVCYNDIEFKKVFDMILMEVELVFGDKFVYIEKFVENLRYIEI